MSRSLKDDLLPRRGFLAGALSLGLAAAVGAGDWPQVLGPRRDGHAADEKLAVWPAAGPKVRWKRDVGSGFAGVAVAGERAILFHRVDKEQIVEALHVDDGRTLWKTPFSTKYVATVAADDGPRCTPVVHRDRVIVFGADGQLACLSLAEGRLLWQRDTHADYDVPESYFGAGSTPLVVGEPAGKDRVLVNIGGRAGSGLVAFDLADGKTLWKTAADQASYSSPISVTVDGQRQAIFVTRLHVVAVDPATGAELYRFDFGKRGPTVNAATPLWCDGRLFVTSSYNIGCIMATVEKRSVTTLWKSADALASQYTTPLYVDGHLYGIDGRADIGTADLRCLDAKTGRVLWTEKDFGIANLLVADGKLIAVKDDGTLVLAEVSPQRYRALATAKVLATTTRALPALSRGTLYVRDAQTLQAISLSP